MKRNYYAPIRHRNDGSLYVDKNHLLKDGLARIVVALVMPLTFAAIVMFALVDPYNIQAQRYEDLIGQETVSAENKPSIFPVRGRLTSNFGYRRNPFGGSSEFHPGQDIAAPRGTPIVAPADGEVIFAGRKRGYGNFVVIQHSDGIITRYGHLSGFVVKENQVIKRGEELGMVGSTGRSTGPHLHYEVLVNEQKVDPMAYLPK